MNIVVILAYFNFSSSEARTIALLKTLGYLEKQVDVILVSHGLNRRVLPQSSNIQVIDIPIASVIWQKERFYNIALSYLKKNHKYVAWIDADLLFSSNDWKEQLKEKLEKYKMVQLFNRVEDITFDNDCFLSTGLIRKSIVEGFEHDIAVKDYFCESGISLKLGCNPGFAWGTKVNTVKEMRFADFMILGSGDKVLLASATGYHSNFFKTLSLNQGLYDRYHSWGDTVSRVINGKIGYLENKIYHIVQGEYKNRNYSSRYLLLKGDDFVIDDYLKINEYGAWQWLDESNEYAVKIKNYFHERED